MYKCERKYVQLCDNHLQINKRVAQRILYLSKTCGGIYFKAGQYIGTLERIAPKEYVEVLKVL
jgi:predicted unusual protein kinase regulating ubiquinone biosynthesis (AarF/ABC1/UbiB family)